MNKIITIMCLFSILATVGCGRVSSPNAPDDAFYPHTYFIQEHTQSENKSTEPIDEELKDQGMIIENIH